MGRQCRHSLKHLTIWISHDDVDRFNISTQKFGMYFLNPAPVRPCNDGYSFRIWMQPKGEIDRFTGRL